MTRGGQSSPATCPPYACDRCLLSPTIAPVTDRPRHAQILDITEVDDGLVVFEPTTRRVHHLNVTATLVFELCNGENDVADITAIVRTAFGLAESPDDEVATLLASLRAEGLIV